MHRTAKAHIVDARLVAGASINEVAERFGIRATWRRRGDYTLLAIAASKMTRRSVRQAFEARRRLPPRRRSYVSEQLVGLGVRSDGALAALIRTGTAAVTSHRVFPARLIGPPRSVMNKYGVSGYSRRNSRSARSSGPRIGCVGGRPFFSRRAASRGPFCS